MEKISNEQIAEVLADASSTLRALHAENTDLKDKLASKERRDRVTKLASEMHRKGLELDTDVETLVSRLEETAKEAGKLETIENAVDLVGPDMGTKIGQASHNPTHDGEGRSSNSSDLERFIVGSAG
jgi:hypothetical protein